MGRRLRSMPFAGRCAAVLLVTLAPTPSEAQAHEHPTSPIASKTEARPAIKGLSILRNESTTPGVVEVTITAAPGRLSLVPGKMTDVYAYNGSVPGPVLELREGDSVIVHFRNDLPEPSTIHWHGIHLPAVQDGAPFDPVPAGASRIYTFRIHPGTAGTYWYHPHLHHRTAAQIGRGLYGALIVRPAKDPIPASVPEKLLILADNRMRPDGSLDFPEPHSPEGRVDLENGREGNLLFVNGELMPTVSIGSGEIQRWRIINSSGARVYRLKLQGHSFLHIGTDGGLFEHPVETDEIVLANAERAEVLVRGTGTPGSVALLQTLPYDRYIPQTRPRDWNQSRDILTLAYTNAAPVRSPEIPARLRHVPPIDTLHVTGRRTITFSQHLVNGRPMDLARVDELARLGATEIWELENIVGMDHPFHLHGFQFQLLDRDGVPEKQRTWKDTVNLPRHSTARFIVRLENHPGKWMYHCHILEHEDAGMMGVLEIQ